MVNKFLIKWECVLYVRETSTHTDIETKFLAFVLKDMDWYLDQFNIKLK